MTVEEVVERVGAFGCMLVEVTGGEPLLQPDAIELMRSLLSCGHEVLLETGGSLPIEHVPEGVRRIVDVKCPGSGECERNRWENPAARRPGIKLKFYSYQKLRLLPISKQETSSLMYSMT